MLGVTAMLITGIITLSFKDPMGYEQLMQSQKIVTDTIPEKVITEKQHTEFNKDVQAVITSAIELAKQALSTLDVDKIKAQMDVAMSKVDMNKVNAEISKALQEVDIEKVKIELDNAKKNWKDADKQKMKAEMEKLQMELKKVDIQKLMNELKFEIQKAKKEIEEAKKEVRSA